MRNPWKVWLASALVTGACASHAQTPTATPAAAPAAQTFVCKDGTTVRATTSQGACKGHKGIDKAASAAPGQAASAAPAAAAKPAPAKAAAAPPAAAPAAAPAGKEAKASTAAPAPGGGPGKVWANQNSKVYHCPGDRYYGTTKQGAYMTEAEAKAQGMHGARNKACS